MPVSAPTAEDEFEREVSAIEQALADQAPDLSVLRAALMRQQIATDPRLTAAMAAGVVLARRRAAAQGR
jgi:hypothetical protein